MTPDAPARLSQLPSYLTYVLLNPAFDLRVALVLYASIALLLLIVLCVGMILLMRPEEGVGTLQARDETRSEEFERVAPGEVFEGLDPERDAGDERRARGPAAAASPPRRPALLFAVTALLVVSAWLAAGHATTAPPVCLGCHPAPVHGKAAARTDPHASVSCVSCHEPGGLAGRYLTGVPARLAHFADSQSFVPRQAEYGRVTRSACASCHRKDLIGVAVDEARGLRVSHAQPLSASAVCTDCHALGGGVVSGHNSGMAPCLRCHDSRRASARCDTCHDRKGAAAARVRTTSFADVRIPEVSCGGCHDEERECDPCHGTRLPHSVEFRAYAHARAGAVDFWYNGGRACSRCHTASRRPCGRCHGESLGKAHGTGTTWVATGHQKADPDACDTCHRRLAYAANRDFCTELCHAPAARAASPR